MSLTGWTLLDLVSCPSTFGTVPNPHIDNIYLTQCHLPVLPLLKFVQAAHLFVQPTGLIPHFFPFHSLDRQPALNKHHGLSIESSR